MENWIQFEPVQYFTIAFPITQNGFTLVIVFLKMHMDSIKYYSISDPSINQLV